MLAAKVLVKHVIGDEAVSKLNSVSRSNNTIQRRITEMSTISKNKSLQKYSAQNMDLPYNRRVKLFTACGLCALCY